MKKNILLVLLAVMTVGMFSSCNKFFPFDNGEGNGNQPGGQDNPVVQTVLPENAEQFILLHFPNNPIVSVEKDGFKYEVVLTGGIELEFKMNGEWIEVDCEPNAVPASIIPEAIASYVAANYPNNFIVKIESTNMRYKVELNNDVELVFNNNGEFLFID